MCGENAPSVELQQSVPSGLGSAADQWQRCRGVLGVCPGSFTDGVHRLHGTQHTDLRLEESVSSEMASLSAENV